MKSLLPVALLLTLASCNTIRTNVARERIPPFSKVLIVTSLNDTSASYARAFRRLIPADYEVFTLGYNPLSVNSREEEIKPLLDMYRPEVILDIRQQPNQISNRRATEFPVSHFTAEMRALSDVKPFWRASIMKEYVLRPSPSRWVALLKRDGLLLAR